MDGCVLTAVARANNGEQLAVADGFGRLRLLRYPAVNDDQVYANMREILSYVSGPKVAGFLEMRCGEDTSPAFVCTALLGSP